MNDKKTKKTNFLYGCEKCDFFSNKKTDYDRHLETRKHKSLRMNDKKTNFTNFYVCDCGKTYKYRQGMFAHKKKCTFLQEEKIKDLQEENNVLKYHLLEKMSNENDFLKKQMEEKNKQINELIPKVGTNKFNINIFLNEKCKNALSLGDFIDNIEITAQALSLTKDEGLTTGLSHLIMENMNKLALHERPIHCSDKKREVLYIKNETWEKDTNNKTTKKFINKLCSKQVNSINKLVHNPDEYVDMLQQCSSSLNEKKLMKDICDIVYVNDPNNETDLGGGGEL